MRTVRQLLEAKSPDKGWPEVHSIGPDAPVIDAIRLMAERRISALLVMEGARLAGIVSERDTPARWCCRSVRRKTRRCTTS